MYYLCCIATAVAVTAVAITNVELVKFFCAKNLFAKQRRSYLFFGTLPKFYGIIQIIDDALHREPLFCGATSRMIIKPLDIATIKEILSDYTPQYTPDDLLVFYMTTGGVAKYIE